jgi:hypothetical protein
MNVPDLAALVLSAMRTLEPSSPYDATFETTAYAVADESTRSPLFAGEEGAARTAALVTSVAWFESRFQPDAAGDCDRTTREGTCAKGARPSSFCLLQINASNHRALGVTADELRTDAATCVRAGLRMMRQSFAACRALPLEERLDWYAGGGPTCAAPSEDARRKSRHRVAKAIWIYRRMSSSARPQVES